MLSAVPSGSIASRTIVTAAAVVAVDITAVGCLAVVTAGNISVLLVG